MSSATIQTSKVIENSGAVLMARIVNDLGVAVVQADISSLTCKVYNNETGTLITSPTLSVGSTIYNTLQTPAAWTADSTGFNFAASLAGSCWPEGGVVYRVEVKVTPASGNPYYLVWDLQALDILSE